MCDEFKNLHWDVPEHQDADPEAIPIHWVFYRISDSIT